MLRISIGESPTPLPPGQSDICTHQLLLAVLAAAPSGRAAILREAFDAVRDRGPYDKSKEELTPLRGDPLAGVPQLIATAATLGQPAAWRWFAAGAVSS